MWLAYSPSPRGGEHVFVADLNFVVGRAMMSLPLWLGTSVRGDASVRGTPVAAVREAPDAVVRGAHDVVVRGARGAVVRGTRGVVVRGATGAVVRVASGVPVQETTDLSVPMWFDSCVIEVEGR